MTADRVDRLNEMGFKWSTAVPRRDTIAEDAAVMAQTKHTPMIENGERNITAAVVVSTVLPLAAAYGISGNDSDNACACR
jgi:hypothetical protein